MIGTAIGGGLLGAGIGSTLFSAAYGAFSAAKAKRENEEYEEHCHENERFIVNVPKSIAPCGNTNYEGRKLTFGKNSAIYDDDGEMVWNSVTGLCGKAVCV